MTNLQFLHVGRRQPLITLLSYAFKSLNKEALMAKPDTDVLFAL